MELIYLYIEKAYGEDYDLHLNFSQHTRIKFSKETGFIVEEIKESEQKVPVNFFGENIVNISAIVGRNGSGKSTIMNVLAFSGQVTNQNNNKYLIIYKDDADYFIEGNITGALLHPVCKRYFDKGFINQKFDNSGYPEGTADEKKLRYLKINSKRCGNQNMFARYWSETSSKQSTFSFLASGEFKKTFKIIREHTNIVRINFTDFIYSPFLSERRTIEDLRNYIKIISPFAYKILSISLSQSRIKSILSKNDRIDTKLLKEQFILSTFQVFYQNLLLFIYSWLYENHHEYNISDELNSIYLKYQDTVNNAISTSDISDWFYNPESLYKSINQLLSEDIEYQLNEDLGINYNFKYIQNQFSGFIESIKRLSKEYFQEQNYIDIDINELSAREIDEISDFLSHLERLEGQIYSFSNCVFSEFSSGEENLIKSFAQLYNQIDDQKGLIYVLLLDEYELHLHPEWSRKFLDYLVSFLASYPNTKFQIILTTHSPYLISDLPRDNIHLIKIKDSGEREVLYPQKSFASNYYDLLKDNFFLEDTVGEFAKRKIDNCIKGMKEISIELNKLNLDNSKEIDAIPHTRSIFSVIDEKIDELRVKLRSIVKVISLVDDKFIHDRLEQIASMLDTKLISSLSNSNTVLEKELALIDAKRADLLKKLGRNND